MQTHAPHVRHIRETLLSDNWYTLKKYTFELLRRDGRWQEQSREAYDRGNGAVILLYNREKRTVVLTRQFRFPVFTHGHDGYLIEAAAGLLDNASPEARIVAEAEGDRLSGDAHRARLHRLYEPRICHRKTLLFYRRISGR
jgi:hypothetical protein